MTSLYSGFVKVRQSLSWTSLLAACKQFGESVPEFFTCLFGVTHSPLPYRNTSHLC